MIRAAITLGPYVGDRGARALTTSTRVRASLRLGHGLPLTHRETHLPGVGHALTQPAATRRYAEVFR